MSDLPLLLFTLRVAAASTLAIAPLALVLAALSWRGDSRLRSLFDVMALLPLVLPPTAVGFVLLELLSRRHSVGALMERMGIEVLFTPAAAVIAAAVMSFPLMFTAFRMAIDSSDRRYFDIARTLGASPLRAFVRVTIPLAWRGLLAGGLLAFCRALGEFGATILVAGNIPGRTQTLALAIYDRVQAGREAEAVHLVVYIILIAVTAVAASEMLGSRRRRPQAA